MLISSLEKQSGICEYDTVYLKQKTVASGTYRGLLRTVLVGVAVNQCDGQAIWQSRFESVRHRIVSPLCIQEQCLTTREGIARRIVTKL